jgi:hypothetical protein
VWKGNGLHLNTTLIVDDEIIEKEGEVQGIGREACNVILYM